MRQKFLRLVLPIRLWWLHGGGFYLNRAQVNRGKRYTFPYRDEVIVGGKRNGIYKTDVLDGWWCAYSPRNGMYAQAEGDWGDWVSMARAILEEDEERRTK